MKGNYEAFRIEGIHAGACTPMIRKHNEKENEDDDDDNIFQSNDIKRETDLFLLFHVVTEKRT